jgi:Na+/H+-translocating membrane pyrophosphatase
MARKSATATIIALLVAGTATVVPFWIFQWILAQISLPPFSYIAINMSFQGIIGWIILLLLVGLAEYYIWRELKPSTISLLE